MEHGTRIKPEYQESLKEFQRLKGEVVALTNPIKKLQLCLEDKLAKIISDLEESENIANSLSILREIMI
jgi:chaperonin cofactor prefoldin